MLHIIKRISRVLALCAVYVICAVWYLTAKGFVFKDGDFIFSHPAYASEQSFSQKVTGDIGISEERERALGDKQAPLTIFALSSMTCAHCRDFHKYTLPKINEDFISKGKVRFVFVHFPLEVVSMRAAKLSYCVPPEKFYEFIDDLYSSRDWTYAEDEKKLYEHAKKIGMTDQDIENCNNDKKISSDILLVRDKVIENFKISGTPSFIVEGRDGKELIVGTKSYSDLKEYLNKRLEAGL